MIVSPKRIAFYYIHRVRWPVLYAQVVAIHGAISTITHTLYIGPVRAGRQQKGA